MDIVIGHTGEKFISIHAFSDRQYRDFFPSGNRQKEKNWRIILSE